MLWVILQKLSSHGVYPLGYLRFVGLNEGTRIVYSERNLPFEQRHANHQVFYSNLQHQFANVTLYLLLLLPDQWLLDADLDIGGCCPGDLFMNFRSLAAVMGLLSASSAIICFFSARHFSCFCKSLIGFLRFCFAIFNLFLESSSSFLFVFLVKYIFKNIFS